MKKIQSIFGAILAGMITYSCSNLEDLNTDPNKSTTVTPELIAAQVIADSYKISQNNANDFASSNLFCQHTAWVAKEPNANQYYWSFWPYGSFSGYKKITDLKRMVQFAEASGAGEQYVSTFKGLELYMKASAAFGMTLSVGDIPYTEVGEGESGNWTPKYDKQADVFAYILEDLRQAETYFAKGVNFKGDIMYGGDVAKWRKLCNAMQLKVLQTMSRKITAEQKARFAQIVADNHLMSGNEDNLQLVYTTESGANHPYWGNEGETNTASNFISELAANALKELKDRRLFIFCDPAKALVAQGKLASDFDAYAGCPTEKSHTILVDGKSKGLYSSINWRYTQFKNGDPLIRFSYAEQCFILAEAVEEGWISGSAKGYYEKGVISMFNYYKNLPSVQGYDHGIPIDQDFIDNYFKGKAAYAIAGTRTDRLKQIWLQRWLIDFFQGNGGNYPQFLRTGQPVLPLDPSTNMNPDSKSTYPQRWMYPTKEYDVNTDNCKKAVQEQYGGSDATNKTPWYLQN